ncbi:MAG: hypothetical protein ACR2MM_10870, partial [Flavobacteriaceae bacterium]
AMKDMNPEQVASLETKKLTLALDLTEQQQAEIRQIELENAEYRKAKMEERRAVKDSEKAEKPSSDERYAMMSDRLDRKIDHKEKMKSILDKSQFEKWEKMRTPKNLRGKCKVHKGKPSR